MKTVRQKNMIISACILFLITYLGIFSSYGYHENSEKFSIYFLIFVNNKVPIVFGVILFLYRKLRRFLSLKSMSALQYFQLINSIVDFMYTLVGTINVYLGLLFVMLYFLGYANMVVVHIILLNLLVGILILSDIFIFEREEVI